MTDVKSMTIDGGSYWPTVLCGVSVASEIAAAMPAPSLAPACRASRRLPALTLLLHC